MNPSTRKMFLATVRQCAVDFMIDHEFAPGGIDVRDYHVMESAMQAISIRFKYPAKVLQEDREIARYPVSLWSHFLQSVGLRRFAKYQVVLLNEHLTFPSIEIPPDMKIGARLVYDYRMIGPVVDT